MLKKTVDFSQEFSWKNLEILRVLPYLCVVLHCDCSRVGVFLPAKDFQRKSRSLWDGLLL